MTPWVCRYAPWIVVAAALVAVFSGVYSTHLVDRLSGGGWTSPGSEEARAERAQDAGFVGRGSSTVALVVRDDRFSTPSAEFDRRVSEVIHQIAADQRLRISSQTDVVVGRDGKTALTTLQLGIDDGTAKRVLPEVERGFSDFAVEGLDVYFVGQSAAFAATSEIGTTALARVEVILLPLVITILVFLYRSVVAAVVSMTISVTAIVIAMGALTWLAGIVELNVIVQSIATMLGLGVSVDYSLIMIRRFVDELRESDRRAALFVTMRTAGRTVAASGATVAAALASLLIIDIPVIRSMAVAAIIVVLTAVAVCLTALPAVLYLLGCRVTAGWLPWLPSNRERGRRRWERLARIIMARPVIALAVTSAVLLALTVPVLGLQTGSGDASVLPQSSSVRQGYDLVEDQYGKGSVEPILVVIEAGRPFSGTTEFAHLESMISAFEDLDHVAEVSSPLPILQAVRADDPFAAIDENRAIVARFISADHLTMAIDIYSDGRAGDSGVTTLLGEVRAVAARYAAPGWRVSVGGLAAVLLSSSQHIAAATPFVIATMLAVMYVLLVWTFQSLLLPCKAIAVNLLSVGAAMGTVVLVFQHGLFAQALGIESVGPIQSFVPILLVAVLFSLSTDYEVFLLSRVRERFQQTGDNTESVVGGVTDTAPLISGAAALMVTIFAAFLSVPLVTVQQMGFATAIAIAIDATVVRLVMVPAAMRLMGRWNWWLPGAITPYHGVHRLDDEGALWVR